MITSMLAFLVNAVTTLLVFACLGRAWMQYARAPFANPAGQAVIALTDFMVKPLRRLIKPVGSIDASSIVAAFLIECVWALCLILLYRSAALLPHLPLLALIDLFKSAVQLVMASLIAQAVISWIAPASPARYLLNALLNPLLTPLQKRIPPLGGVLDLSPLVLILMLEVILIGPIAWLGQYLLK